MLRTARLWIDQCTMRKENTSTTQNVGGTASWVRSLSSLGHGCAGSPPQSKTMRRILVNTSGWSSRNVTMKQLENIETISLVGDEIREQDVQTIIDLDEVVPVLRPAANGCLV